MAVDPARLKCHAATPSRWKDISTLFGKRGACGGCWCMFLRLTHRDFEQGKGPGNKRAFKKLVMTGRPAPGVIAYYDGKPIGWCAVAPREAYSYFERSRVLKPIDDKSVWSVTCFFILRAYRRQGVSLPLLEATVDYADRRGARIVEGYPHIPYSSNAAAAFISAGVLSTFEQAGFKEVARRTRLRPIMRRVLHHRGARGRP